MSDPFIYQLVKMIQVLNLVSLEITLLLTTQAYLNGPMKLPCFFDLVENTGRFKLADILAGLTNLNVF